MLVADPKLPAEDLVQQGLQDLRADKETIAALFVAIGAPRLRRLGVDVPDDNRLPARPEHRLYALFAREDARTAHAGYNALVRALVSYEHALELARARAARAIDGAATAMPPTDVTRLSR